MSFQPVDYLVHFSNVLMLASYSVRDILWLRWFAVAAALTNIPYFLLQPTTLWATDYLGAGVHDNQSVSDPSYLPGKAPGDPFRRRTKALQHGLFLPAATGISSRFCWHSLPTRGRRDGSGVALGRPRTLSPPRCPAP